MSSSSSVAQFCRPCPKNGYYDVFLSFRGKDTRYGFTANLYDSLKDNQVYTFMDIKLVGKVIDSLFEIIKKSKMAVVVYSERFASSDWCLRELDMILQRMKDGSMLMIPIFYKVKVDELKHLTGNTGKYLEQLIPKHGHTNVHKWKTAVTTLGRVSGLSYGDNRYESVFIAEVVKTAKEMLEELPVGSSIKPHSSGLAMDQNNKTELDLLIGSFQEMKTAILNRLDEKNESTWNQQAHVSLPKEETLAAQTNSFPHTTEVQYSLFITAFFQKVQEIKGELLIIQPAGLRFLVTPKKPSYATLILTNKTDNYVAFRLIGKHTLQIRADPCMGVLLPRSVCKIIVTMKEDSMLPRGMRYRDMCSVQSMKVKNDSYSAYDIDNMFAEESVNAIDTRWMMVLCKVDAPEDHPAQLLSNNVFVAGEADRVVTIDLHPKKPWLLLGLLNELLNGNVCIWNYETRAEEMSLRVHKDDSPARAVFIHKKHWIVVGSHNGFVYVFNYKTLKKVKEFKAHSGPIDWMGVHPTWPYLLTTATNRIFKLWDWENDSMYGETFEGHLLAVSDVAFNPVDSRSFATASCDGTIKIWSFGSSVAKFTINAHSKGRCTVEYFVGNDNKLYLLSGGSDNSVKVWDYESKTLVQTLEGHTNFITAIFVHPNLSIILTASADRIIRIWNKNTYQLEAIHVYGRICWSFKFINASDEIACGCDDGMLIARLSNANGSGQQQQLASRSHQQANRSASSSSYGTAI